MPLPGEVILDSAVSSSLRKHPLILPFTSIAALRFPAIAIAIFCAALAFGSCYVLNISMQSAFSQPPYRYSPTIVGFLFIPNSVGCIIVSVFGGRWVDRIMVQAAEKAARYDDNGRLTYLPEDRLGPNAWISLALYPASLVAYGWMVQKGVHWVAPSIASFFFGGGVMMVFSATTTMAAEFIPGNSSTGVALNNLIRNIFSCVGTFGTQPLLDVMGHGWLFTMVGLVTWLSGYAGVFILKRNSTKWRKQMEKSWGKATR
jgi:MFS family permease